jgi:hypothetical protein
VRACHLISRGEGCALFFFSTLHLRDCHHRIRSLCSRLSLCRELTLGTEHSAPLGRQTTPSRAHRPYVVAHHRQTSAAVATTATTSPMPPPPPRRRCRRPPPPPPAPDPRVRGGVELQHHRRRHCHHAALDSAALDPTAVPGRMAPPLSRRGWRRRRPTRSGRRAARSRRRVKCFFCAESQIKNSQHRTRL